jgi:hypothetical protein
LQECIGGTTEEWVNEEDGNHETEKDSTQWFHKDWEEKNPYGARKIGGGTEKDWDAAYN